MMQNKAIEYAPLTQKQVDYISKIRTSWLSVAEGGKRAGKNIVDLIGWAIVLETHPDRLHLAAGFTMSTAMMNIIDSNGFGLKWIFKGRCREGEYQKCKALYIQTKVGEKIVLISGGGKENDKARIKGFTLGTVYISEANECHTSFIKECFDRTLSSNERHVIMDLNPKPPRHRFYTEILNFHTEQQEKDPKYGLNYQHFTVADNLSITTEKLRLLLSTYDIDSQWYKQDIAGERTAASGRIYTGYRYKDIAVTAEWIREQKFVEFSVGVDIGGTDATVATLNGFTKNHGMAVAIDGYYHKQGIETGMDHATYAKKIAQFIKKWTFVYPLLASRTVYAESADKLFRQALRKALDAEGLHGMQIVPAYKADGILDRINLMRILINQGRKKIAEHMVEWLDAYADAVWDTKEYEDKEWVRVDDGSYPVDCLDSDEYSIQPYKPLLVTGEVA